MNSDLVIQCDYSHLSEMSDEMEIFQRTGSKPFPLPFLRVPFLAPNEGQVPNEWYLGIGFSSYNKLSFGCESRRTELM